MSKLKNMFKFSESEDCSDSVTIEKNKNSIILRNDSSNFLEKLLNFLPTPEDELENIKKDEETLLNNIKEIKEVLDKIEFRINELQCNESEDFDYKDLLSKKDYYLELLESYEADYEYANIHKKSLGYLIEDCQEGDDKFEEQIPELLTKTFVNTKKKMEDVNSVVKILENQAKKNKIEECIECGAQFRDAIGRKNCLKHFHLTGFDTLKKYKPIICLDCFLSFKTSKNEKLENLKDIEFEEDLSEESGDLCKKGNKIFNSKNILNNPEFLEKGKKFIELENKEFIENIRKEGKKSLFDSFF